MLRNLSLCILSGSLALLVLAAGCASSSQDPIGPTTEQIELENARTSLEMVQSALKGMADERDRFQDLYVTAVSELNQRIDDVEFYEAQFRERSQSTQQREDRLAELERELAIAKSQFEQNRALVESLKESNERQRKRLDEAFKERDGLQRQLTESEALREELVAANEKFTQERSELEERLAAANVGINPDSHDAVVTLKNDLKALNDELAVLRPLKVEVRDLETKIKGQKATNTELQDRIDELLRARGQVEALPGVEKVGFDLLQYGQRSYNELLQGEFNRDNLIAAGVVLAIAFFFCFVLILMIKVSRSKRRVRQMEAQMAEFESRLKEPQRPPSTAKRFSVPPDLVAKQQQQQTRPQVQTRQQPVAPRPQVATPPSSYPQQVAPQAQPAPPAMRRPAPPVPSQPVEEPTQLMGRGTISASSSSGAWNNAVTEDLDEAISQQRSGQQQPVRPTKPATPPKSDTDDDDLLRDLRQVIDKKFS